MKKILFTFCCLFLTLTLIAQRKEQGFDVSFKPTEGAARYYVVTEKKDSGWHRQAWYLPEKTIALDAWYQDEKAATPHGEETWYHLTKFPRSTGRYVNGKKEGSWMRFDEEGNLVDSAFYKDGRLKGIRLGWSSDGYLVDSSHFDGAGNGTEVSWYKEGGIHSAGFWVSDTIKKGRWKYYHANGEVMATEDYVDGKVSKTNCYDDKGNALNDCDSREADFPGGNQGWRRFLERNLRADVPSNNGAPSGEYKIMVQFIVEKDGSISDLKSLTRYGFGMEEELLRLMKQSPKWVPAMQFGRPVKAYRKQPVTFMISR
jgi:antitoxin component YwqK of YwqJK toxin-antitoxin module